MTIRTTIHDLICTIEPHDLFERDQIAFTLLWLQSAHEIFRIAKPATPDTHLVSYFVVFDPEACQILLTDHRKSGLWLPPGGHVELNEHPSETVRREAQEELYLEADFLIENPLFLTVTKTVGATAGHTDVSLWYVLRGDSSKHLEYDPEEFKEIRWFSLENVPFDRTDLHMERFVNKLKELDKLNLNK